MDIEMPEMSGLQALAAIRRTNPTLPVIMVSTLTERGAVATLEALALGATDYITKPSTLTASGEAEREHFVRDLLPKLRGLGGPRRMAAVKVATPAAPGAVQPLVRRSARIEIVAIGVSTGGPNALAELIPALPADFPVPIVIVQHMPPLFTRLLAERLDDKSAIRVKEGSVGEPLANGLAIIAPGGNHMVVERGAAGNHVGLNSGPLENSCRPAIVMTGMGQDGLHGCEVVRQRGGHVFVQDEKTSVVWGMPGFVAEAGLADEILPLNQLAPAIVRSVRVGRDAARVAGGGKG